METCPFKGNRNTLPQRMERLPIDDRGYVVPWFVGMVDGKYEFRGMDGKKWIEAVRFKKCWVCGGFLGRFMTFVAGPMCGINRTSSEPPSHLECAVWSAQNCPFLNNPDMVRRVDEKMPMYQPENVAGYMIPRNPGVTLLWTCSDYSVWDPKTGGGLPLITFGEPTQSLLWFREGRAATREEILASIEAGIPALETVAAQQGKEGLEHLAEQKKRFEKYIPAR